MRNLNEVAEEFRKELSQNLCFSQRERRCFIAGVKSKEAMEFHFKNNKTMRKFLHTHPVLEKSLGLDSKHVIVDREDWEKVTGGKKVKVSTAYGVIKFPPNITDEEIVEYFEEKVGERVLWHRL